MNDINLKKGVLILLSVIFGMSNSLKADVKFQSGGSAVWSLVDGGVWKSGKISGNQNSWLRTVVVGKGRFSFCWKVSCECNDYDYLEFLTNGVRAARISGEREWSSLTFDFVWDAETSCEWRYVKDGSVNSGNDCGWVDSVVWTAIADVSFDSDGGSSVDGRKCFVGSPVGELPTPTKNHCDFVGWYTTRQFGGERIEASTIVTDVRTVYYARWQERSYTVSFDLGRFGVRTGGGELIQTVKEGDPAIAPVFNANAAGGIISGWDADFSSVESNMTICAVYANGKCHVHYDYGTFLTWSRIEDTTVDWGTDMSFTSTNVILDAQARYRNVGWRYNGNSCSQEGIGVPNVSVTVTNDVDFSWCWAAEYYVEAKVVGDGEIDFADGWYPAGYATNIFLAAREGSYLSSWSVGEDVFPSEDPKTQTMNVAISRPTVVEAKFKSNAEFYRPLGPEAESNLAVAFGTIDFHTDDQPEVIINGKRTIGRVEKGVARFEFDNVSIGSRVDVSVHGNRPLAIFSKNDFILDTTISVAGVCGAGKGGVGPKGGAGGRGSKSIGHSRGGSGGAGQGFYNPIFIPGQGYPGDGQYRDATEGSRGHCFNVKPHEYYDEERAPGSVGSAGLAGASPSGGYQVSRFINGGRGAESGVVTVLTNSVAEGGVGGKVVSSSNPNGTGGDGGRGASGEMGAPGSRGFDGQNGFNVMDAESFEFEGGMGGSSGGSGSGGSGGAGGCYGAGGGGGGGGSWYYFDMTTWVNGGNGGMGGDGGEGGFGGVGGEGGVGGNGGNGGGCLILSCLGTLCIGPNGRIDISQTGREEGKNGRAGQPGLSGSAGCAGEKGEYGGCIGGNGGNGGAGGDGGRGGVGGKGGNGGYGAPGTVKLSGSAIVSAGGDIVADNGNGDADESRVGRVTFISNLMPDAVQKYAPGTMGSPRIGRLYVDEMWFGSAPYDEMQKIPFLGQLEGGAKATSGIVSPEHFQWGVVSNSIPELNVGGVSVYRLRSFFSGYDQVFLFNTTDSTIGGAVFTVGDSECAVPRLSSHRVWSTCVRKGDECGVYCKRIIAAEVLGPVNLGLGEVSQYKLVCEYEDGRTATVTAEWSVNGQPKHGYMYGNVGMFQAGDAPGAVIVTARHSEFGQEVSASLPVNIGIGDSAGWSVCSDGLSVFVSNQENHDGEVASYSVTLEGACEVTYEWRKTSEQGEFSFAVDGHLQSKCVADSLWHVMTNVIGIGSHQVSWTVSGDVMEGVAQLRNINIRKLSLSNIEIVGAEKVQTNSVAQYGCVCVYDNGGRIEMPAIWSLSQPCVGMSIGKSAGLMVAGEESGECKITAFYEEGGKILQAEKRVSIIAEDWRTSLLEAGISDVVNTNNSAWVWCYDKEGASFLARGGVVGSVGLSDCVFVLDGEGVLRFKYELLSRENEEGVQFEVLVDGQLVRVVTGSHNQSGCELSVSGWCEHVVVFRSFNAGRQEWALEDMVSISELEWSPIPELPVSLEIVGGDILRVGGFGYYGCRVVYDSGRTMDVKPVWSIVSATATVEAESYADSMLFVQTGSAGSFVIEAVFEQDGESFKASKTVRVKNAVVKICIVEHSSCSPGDSFECECLAYYSDGSTKKITPVWSIVAGSEFASISSGGVVTAKCGAGDVTVRAEYKIDGGDFEATSTIRVRRGENDRLLFDDLCLLLGGDLNWLVQSGRSHDGGTALQSPDMKQGESASFSFALTGPGTLSFWWKCDMADKYDRLVLLKNGFEQKSISGSTDWQRVVLELPNWDVATFSWNLEKGSVYSGMVGYHSYRGWVDEIEYVPSELSLSSISVDGPGLSYTESQLAFKCVAHYSNGMEREVKAKWSLTSDLTETSRIDEDTGVLTLGTEAGSVTISVEYEESNVIKTAEWFVVVLQNPNPHQGPILVGVDVYGPDVVYVGETFAYECWARYSDGGEKRVGASWELLNGSDCANLGTDGVLVALSDDGCVKIQAEYSEGDMTHKSSKSVEIRSLVEVPASVTGGSPVEVPISWTRKFAKFKECFGTDYLLAMLKATGKKDGSGRFLCVWDDYVAGTDPTDETSQFRATIEVEDGLPKVMWEPNLNKLTVDRTYKVYGRRSLSCDDAWEYPANSAVHRFFKVDVSMPDENNGGSDIPGVIDAWQPVAIPTAVNGLVYDGTVKLGVLPRTGYTLSGASATGAGNYIASAVLEGGYKWTNGSQADQQIPWTIAKANNAWVSAPTMSATTFLSGSAVTVTDGVSKFGTVARNYSNSAIQALAAGSYTLVSTVYGTANYMGLTHSIPFTVTGPATKIALPSAKTGLVYTGSTQTGVATGTGYTLSGNTGVNAGTYTATATLKSGYEWSDGVSSQSRTISWSIAKATNSWLTQPSLSSTEFEEGSTVTISMGSVKFGVKQANYTAAELVQLAAGSYTLVVSVTGTDNYTGLTKSIPFTVTESTSPSEPLYCVVDLSAGPTATEYPVEYLSRIPQGGWTDEHKTTKLVLRLIDSGEFMMHGKKSTTISQPYYIGVFEMTQKQYELIVGDNPSKNNGAYGVGAKLPVTRISYDEIRGADGWPLSDAVGSASVMGLLREKAKLHFDLPTSAQWEFAARAGSTTDKYWGGHVSNAYMWYMNNSDNHLHEVGLKISNDFGLYDVLGNADEWCLDNAGKLAYGTDPKGVVDGDGRRVTRGGQFAYGESDCGCNGNDYDYGVMSSSAMGYGLGFRIVITN